MNYQKNRWTVTLVAIAILTGCNKNADQAGPTIDGSLYRLTSEPAGAVSVLELRNNGKDNDEIVIHGRIGGVQPWVEGLSVFTLVDSSFPSCNEIPDDECPTPWDYCCEPDLESKTALVKVVDQHGKPLGVGAQELLGLKELQNVVVQGKVQLDSSGNLSVVASGVYIRQ